MYQTWIEKNVPIDPNSVLAKCIEYTTSMLKEFPELKLIKGVVWSKTNPDNFGSKPKEYEHCWLVDKYENVIDPTAHQYYLLSNLQYKTGNYIGKCMNCGCYSTYTSYACSKECEKELSDYYKK